MEIITSSITSQSTSKTILNKEISTHSGAHDYLKIIKDHMHFSFCSTQDHVIMSIGDYYHFAIDT